MTVPVSEGGIFISGNAIFCVNVLVTSVIRQTFVANYSRRISAESFSAAVSKTKKEAIKSLCDKLSLTEQVVLSRYIIMVW